MEGILKFMRAPSQVQLIDDQAHRISAETNQILAEREVHEATIQQFLYSCESARQALTGVFDAKLDSAFEGLLQMSAAVLSSSSPSLQSDESVSTTVRDTKARFHDLLIDARTVLEELGTESEKIFAEESTLATYRNSVKDRMQSLRDAREQAGNRLDQLRGDRNVAQNEYDEASRRLSDKEDELDSVWHVFDDKGAVLNPLRADRDRAQQRLNNLNALVPHEEVLYNTIGECIGLAESGLAQSESLLARAKDEERAIINKKEAASEVYQKVYDMEVCMEGGEIEFEKDECLRHILRLVHVQATFVDTDAEVTDFKKRIHALFLEHYTEAEIVALEENKPAAIEFEI